MEGNVSQNHYNTGNVQQNNYGNSYVQQNDYNNGNVQQNNYGNGYAQQTDYNNGNVQQNNYSNGYTQQIDYNNGNIPQGNFNNGYVPQSNFGNGEFPPANPGMSPKKKFGLISMIAGILCVIFIAVSALSVTDSTFLEIPVFGMILGEDAIDEANEKLDEGAEEFERALERMSDKNIAEIEDIFGMTVDELAEIFRNPSLNDFIGLAETLVEEKNALKLLESEDVEDAMEMLDMDNPNEGLDLMSIVRISIWGYAAFIALLALLGALIKSKGCTIAAMIVSLPFYIFLAGWVLLVIYYVLSIVHIVLAIKAKHA